MQRLVKTAVALSEIAQRYYESRKRLHKWLLTIGIFDTTLTSFVVSTCIFWLLSW